MTYDVDMFNDIFNDDDDIPNDDMFDENFALLGATLLTLKQGGYWSWNSRKVWNRYGILFDLEKGMETVWNFNDFRRSWNV